MIKKLFLIYAIVCSFAWQIHAETGYDLWLRYPKITDQNLSATYKADLKQVVLYSESLSTKAIEAEFSRAYLGMLGISPEFKTSYTAGNAVIVAKADAASGIVKNFCTPDELKSLNTDGFLIRSVKIKGKTCVLIVGNTDLACLYGTFHFLKLLQLHENVSKVSVVEVPKLNLRLLNHWDNLDRTVERGYAGFSLWDWHRLPGYLDPRYTDYARACASVGINGVVLNNVNANALILTEEYLVKIKALSSVFEPYGIRVFLTSRFSAPIEIGGLKSADPLDATVQTWWNNKVNEIYSFVPNFGGFLVKANSEGQPGPQNYGRNHADGANMLAKALAPHKGVVMWRAFVYDNKVPDDRSKQAYTEFVPLDGKFEPNVLVQVKNGPIDFQPREPFHPIFGAMPKTPLMLEVQLTQEYLGFATHLVYLAPLYKECLDADTYAKGQGSTVAKVLEGRLDAHQQSGIAGVANIGNDLNWCGHPFAQANWYAFGRLAWNPEADTKAIAQDWVRQTFTNDEKSANVLVTMMMASREITVDYMTPLGLHHIMGWSHHYGPGPWIANKPRVDWTSVYYHKADSLGLGFDRTREGSGAVAQYFPPVEAQFASLDSCPENLLLWFHHVSWDYKMRSGKTLWNELCAHYYAGVDSVKWMQNSWQQVRGQIDESRFREVEMLLQMQYDEAVVWRNSCVLYFQSFSKRAIPAGLPKPDHDLQYYINKKYSFVPGN